MRRLAALLLALAAACAGAPAPAPLDTRNDACASCRMIVSDPRFAAQIGAPGEEPVLFDDLGCLRTYLASGRALPKGARVWVADHRTKAWVPAADAVFTESKTSAPMGSRLMAHADEASLASDPEARTEARVPAAVVLGRTLAQADR